MCICRPRRGERQCRVVVFLSHVDRLARSGRVTFSVRTSSFDPKPGTVLLAPLRASLFAAAKRDARAPSDHCGCYAPPVRTATLPWASAGRLTSRGEGGGSIDTQGVTTYRPMTAADVPQMAEVHLDVFEGYFMTHMGRRFISLYYSQYLDHPHAYPVVAINSGRVIGFIVGACDMGALERRFYRRHFLTLGVIIVTRFIVNRAARASIAERSKIIRRAVASVLRPSSGTRKTARPKRTERRVEDGRTASILSIAVARPFRGSGVGGRLSELFQEAARRDGVTMVMGTVKRENVDHIARKTKGGWQIIHADDKAVTYGYRLTSPESELDRSE